MTAVSGSGKPINFRPITGTCLYRSSQPEDGVTSSTFKSAGIKTIIDLRDTSEVKGSPFCADYRVCVVKPTRARDGTPELKPFPSSNNSVSPCPSGVYAGVHGVCSLINHTALLTEANVFKKFIIIIAYLLDTILSTKLATTLVIRWVLNRNGNQSLLWLYKHIVDRHQVRLNAALQLLVEPSNVPAVVMCSMGKDRTGVTCMLIGHICGQSEEHLIHEYSLTQERYDNQPGHRLIKGFDKLKMHDSFKHAKSETMRGLIDYIKERYGSIDQYLDKIGFSKDHREKLQQNVLAKD